MTNFEKQKLLNDFIFNKTKHCKETSLLPDNEKKILQKLAKGKLAYNNDFLMLLSDELQEQKNTEEPNHMYIHINKHKR